MALESIFKEMYYEPIKEWQSRQTYILDLNNPVGCLRHPGTVHQKDDIDICYYTMQGSNQTQGQGALDEWDLDAERTGKLWWKLRTVFPNSTILAHPKIIYRVKQVMDIPRRIEPDSKYNHDLHMHVYMRTKINGED